MNLPLQKVFKNDGSPYYKKQKSTLDNINYEHGHNILLEIKTISTFGNFSTIYNSIDKQFIIVVQQKKNP